jgi:peptide/nickel transport system permease protein
MSRFVLRRLILAIPVLLGVVTLVFILARVIPSDPCRAALGEKATDEICNAFNIRYGLDQPILVQYLQYIGNLLTGDLGTSIRFNRSVSDMLVERLPVTVELTLYALLFATVVGIFLGRAAATRRNSPADVGTMVVANLGVSIPVFVLGLMLAYVFAVVLKDTIFALPPSGRLTAGTEVIPIAVAWGIPDLAGPLGSLLNFLSNIYTANAVLTLNGPLFVDAASHLILPAIAVGTIPLAIIARMTRSSLLEVLGLDFIRTARAKGLRERFVISRHGMRNAMLPVVTVIGLSIAGFLSGAILTETIFNLAGIGKTLFEAIQGRDYIVIQGVTMVVAIGYVMINLVVDVSYAILDPRIRLG